MKRISLMIREDQAQRISEMQLNLSGLIRDLIDDYLSEYKITLSVSESTKSLYDQIISNTGSEDSDLEIYLRESLKGLVKDKIQAMIELQKQI